MLKFLNCVLLQYFVYLFADVVAAAIKSESLVGWQDAFSGLGVDDLLSSDHVSLSADELTLVSQQIQLRMQQTQLQASYAVMMSVTSLMMSEIS